MKVLGETGWKRKRKKLRIRKRSRVILTLFVILIVSMAFSLKPASALEYTIDIENDWYKTGDTVKVTVEDAGLNDPESVYEDPLIEAPDGARVTFTVDEEHRPIKDVDKVHDFLKEYTVNSEDASTITLTEAPPGIAEFMAFTTIDLSMSLDTQPYKPTKLTVAVDVAPGGVDAVFVYIIGTTVEDNGLGYSIVMIVGSSTYKTTGKTFVSVDAAGIDASMTEGAASSQIKISTDNQVYADFSYHDIDVAVIEASNNGDAISVELPETGLDTGVFEGTFKLVDGSTDDSLDELQSEDCNTITATYNGASDTAGVDDLGPTITELTPPRDAYVNVKRPKISAVLTDGKSGIDETSIDMIVGVQDVDEIYDSITRVVSYTPTVDLDEGLLYVSVEVSDLLGNNYLELWSFIVDTIAPPAPTVEDPGPINSANVEEFHVTGTAEPGSTVIVKLTDSVSGEVQLSGATDPTTGAFDIELSASGLEDGDISVTAYATDIAGNAGLESAAIVITKDTEAPVAPIASFMHVTMNQPGTEDTIHGLALAVEDKATVNVYSDEELTSLIDSIGAESDGSFSAILIGDNMYDMVWVTATDAVDNEGPATSMLNDIAGPPVPELLSPEDDFATTDTTPAFDWSDVTDPSGVIYDIEIDSILVEEGLEPSDYVTAELDDDVYDWRVRAVDGAGNLGTWTELWSFTVDNEAPTITPLTPETFTDEAMPLISAGLDDDLSGIDEENIVMEVDGGVVVAGYAGGVVSYTPLEDLEEVLHEVFVEVSDLAGNSMTSIWTFTVDTTDPVVKIDTVTTPTKDTPQEVTGTYTEINLDTISVDGEEADIDFDLKEWSAVIDLTEGSNLITVTATDKAGNEGTIDTVIILDTTEPDTTIDDIPDFVKELTEITGTALDTDPGAVALVRIQIIAAGTYWDGTDWIAEESWLTATGTTDWSYNNLPTWEDSVSYTIKAKAIDDAGNEDTSPATDSFTYDIETTTLTFVVPEFSPAGPMEIIVISDEDLKAPPTVTVTDPDAELHDVTFTGKLIEALTWSYDFTVTVDCVHSIDATGEDLAGNTVTGDTTFQGDRTPPSISEKAPEGYVTTSTPTISAKLEDIKSGVDIETVMMTVDGVPIIPTIDGELTPDEWGEPLCTAVGSSTGTVTVYAQATTDALYLAFDTSDVTDNRGGAGLDVLDWNIGLVGSDFAPPNSFPWHYVLVTKVYPDNSWGDSWDAIDNGYYGSWGDTWDDPPYYHHIPVGLEMVTSFATGHRVTEFKVPMSLMFDGEHGWEGPYGGETLLLGGTFSGEDGEGNFDMAWWPQGIDHGKEETYAVATLAELVITETLVSYTPGQDLAEGLHDVTVDVSDPVGNPAETSWEFFVDTKTPTVQDLTAVSKPLRIELDWSDASDPEPGSGVIGYNIYRSTISPVETITSNLLAYVYAPDTEYPDNFDPEAEEGVTYYYVVTVEDEAGNEGKPSNTPEATYFKDIRSIQYEIDLWPTWNLISLPLIPEDTAIEAVLDSVIYDVDIVWSYDPTADPEWTFYQSGVGDLKKMFDGKGYWIYMKNNATLSGKGYEMIPAASLPAYSVYKGWNLIGFKTYDGLGDGFIGEDDDMYGDEYLENYFAEEIASFWQAIDQNAAIKNLLPQEGFISYDADFADFVFIDLYEDLLTPGEGYWIYLTEDGTIAPPPPGE